ncbi:MULTISPECIES: hypothetical protein [Wolbachia]|uniref:hypothetical protein n=1 Tax=Wolbachia TaxID=953 RepID=UPI0003477B60|nr:hypothetical protein wHmt_12390 [Wolbachia pipientis]
MSEKIANNYVGLVNYQELESNILSSIREGRPLTGRDGTIDKEAARGKFRR